MRLPSVTQIISQVGRYWLNFDAVPSDRLQVAQERGSAFHDLAYRHATKLWVDEIPDNCAGFFHSFRVWFDEFVEELVLAEKTLIHPTLGFTGTPDLICRLKGDTVLTLVDHKTPQAFSKSWRLQLAAYRELAVKNGYHVQRVGALQPDPDGGKAKFTEYTKSLTPDWNVFLSGLNWWRFFQ